MSDSSRRPEKQADWKVPAWSVDLSKEIRINGPSSVRLFESYSQADARLTFRRYRYLTDPPHVTTGRQWALAAAIVLGVALFTFIVWITH